MAVILAVVVSAPAVLAATPPKLPWQGPAVRVKPGRLVVTFAASTSRVERGKVNARVGGRPIAPARADRVQVVKLAPGLSVREAIRRYEADPAVVAAEPDRFAVLTEIPDDPHFEPHQWALHNTGLPHRISEAGIVSQNSAAGLADRDVDAPEAWDAAAATPGDQEVVVAVLDNGVDIDHPDLAGALWVNDDEVPDNDMDDDGNGYVDDVHGWDFKQGDANPSPQRPGNIDNSHGTHVAGIVAATRNDTVGIAGVCGTCRIMALRFDLSLGQEIDAIAYARDNGADIINMSFASAIWSPAERTAIKQAGAGAEGVLTVVAAANYSADNDIAFYPDGGFAPAYPASYTLPTVLSVAASNHRDQYALVTECDLSSIQRWRCAFTSWGHDSVDVAAPGVDIVSTIAPEAGGDAGIGYAAFDGTSMASPLVAGIAGLVISEHGYGPVQAKNAVMNSVDRPSSLKMLSSWANQTGLPKTSISGGFTRTQGRVNALKALTASTTNATPLTDGNIDGAVLLGGSVTRTVTWPRDVNDVYRKRLFGGNRYRITLNGPAGKDMDLMVWRPGTTEIHQFTAGCFFGGPCPWVRAMSVSADADERVTFSVAETGTFFVQVQGWYSGGRYTLSVKRL